MERRAYDTEAFASMILFSDNHLLAVDKPPGTLTQDSGTGARNLEDWAREWIRKEKNKPGAVFLNAVHRIDRVVGGVVLFARTSKALSRLTGDVRARRCRKTYEALVEGAPTEPEGRAIHWLVHAERRAECAREGTPGAKRAVLRYRVLEREEDVSRLEIELETGRYHQIRAQLSALGTPILGDAKYGAKRSFREEGIALLHARLEIRHPVRKDPILFESRRKLRRDVPPRKSRA